MASPIGPMALAVVCDGMGGLQRGEVASMAIVSVFSQWADYVLPELTKEEIADETIRSQWEHLLRLEHEKLLALAEASDIKIGSTVVALLVTQSRYYALNIGDSRLYRLDGHITQLTQDHTVAEKEARQGNLTVQQAETSPVRSVLTRCVGVGETPRPDFFFGEPKENELYLLCSDGFRHKIAAEEMLAALRPRGGVLSKEDVRVALRYLIEEDKRRGEGDNISAAVISTWPSN